MKLGVGKEGSQVASFRHRQQASPNWARQVLLHRHRHGGMCQKVSRRLGTPSSKQAVPAAQASLGKGQEQNLPGGIRTGVRQEGHEGKGIAAGVVGMGTCRQVKPWEAQGIQEQLSLGNHGVAGGRYKAGEGNRRKGRTAAAGARAGSPRQGGRGHKANLSTNQVQ